MPDESDIIEQQPFCVIYRHTKHGPTVPYGAVDHGNGERNNGFFDLREMPEVLDLMPEVEGCPGLKKFLLTVNGPDSPLMSLGCAHCLINFESPQPDGPTCYIGSYVDLTFRNPQTASDMGNLLKLARAVCAAADLRPENWGALEIGIQEMPGFFGESGCFNVTVNLIGYGRTPEEANFVWQKLYAHMAAAAPGLIQGLRREGLDNNVDK